MIHGLLEVDVTRAREFLRDHKAKTSESLSFTAFIITCLAQAVNENKALQAYRSMTLSFNHDLIDGAPAARFTERLKELIESGYDLSESEAEFALAL